MVLLKQFLNTTPLPDPHYSQAVAVNIIPKLAHVNRPLEAYSMVGFFFFFPLDQKRVKGVEKYRHL